MGVPLVIELDPAGADSAYEQIAAQLRGAIATGVLAPDTALPGVRSLASDLGVNLNTVARAYRLLEQQGFVRIRDRSGVVVAEPARRADPAIRRALDEEAWSLLVRMRQAGVGAAEVRRLVLSLLDRLERA